jgi:hypothetical protein
MAIVVHAMATSDVRNANQVDCRQENAALNVYVTQPSSKQVRGALESDPVQLLGPEQPYR